jgi:AsmA protein
VIPLALLREMDAQGKLKVGSLKAFGIRSESVLLNVSAREGRIALGPNSAKLYGGEYAGRTTIDASGKVPRFQFEEKLARVQIGPFLKDADVFDRYSGTGDVNLKLTAQGLDADQITRTLNGTTAVNLRDGKIEGVNLQKIVRDARAVYDKARGKEVRATAQPTDETAFQSLTATVNVTNGVARNSDLKLAGPVVRASGKGTADLVKQVIDYRLQVTVAEEAGREGTTVPVRVGGTFAEPSFSVEFGAILKEQAERAIEQKLEKKLDERLDRLRQKLLR